MSHDSAIHWELTLVARMPGRRAYERRRPTDEIDTHSLTNLGYWAEGEVDAVREAGGTVVRIEVQGMVT